MRDFVVGTTESYEDEQYQSKGENKLYWQLVREVPEEVAIQRVDYYEDVVKIDYISDLPPAEDRARLEEMYQIVESFGKVIHNDTLTPSPTAAWIEEKGKYGKGQYRTRGWIISNRAEALDIATGNVTRTEGANMIIDSYKRNGDDFER